MPRIYIFDTTLRDGEQSPGVSLDHKEKLEIAHQLTRLGVDIIEAGFPIASPGDFEGVRAIARSVKGVSVAGLCRAVKPDIDRAWEAVREGDSPRLHTFIATSDIHLKYKLQKTREEVLEQAVWAVKYAKQYCSEVEFSAEDASRSDMDYLVQVVTAVIEAGATVVNLPDTVGYAVPGEYASFIAGIIERVPNADRAIFSVHCHDDLGLAVANSLAAVSAGARQVECTVNGIGERAGNAALEEIVMGLYTRKDVYQGSTGINYRELYRTSRLVSHLTGMVVQPNKAVVGKNAFAHESGIHQDGVLKERTTYEIMSPELVGVTTGSNLVLGKHSGRHAFNDRLQQLGFDLSEEELQKAFQRFKQLADKKKEVTDEDLEAIVKDEVWKVPERFRLNYLHFMAGSTIIPTATVGLAIEGLVFEEAATGDGPVDASYRAVDKITNLHGELLEFKVNAVTGGKDALGEVAVRVRIEGRDYMGRGTSTDIIEAGVRAYINAVNKAAFYEDRKENGNGNGH